MWWPVRVSAIAAALLCVAMAGTLLEWLTGFSSHCDYPEDCLERWFPIAYERIGWLWIATAGVGVLHLVCVLRWHAPLFIRGVAAVAVSVSVLAYLAAPSPGLFGGGEVETIGAPWFDNTYAWAALAYAGSALGFALNTVASRPVRKAEGADVVPTPAK